MATSNFNNGGMLFKVTCWIFIIFQLTYYLPLNFHIQLCINSSECLSCSKVQFPLQFHLPDVVIALDATPTQWHFYFQGFLVTFVHDWTLVRLYVQGLYCLTEDSSTCPILCRIAFWLSGKVVAFKLGNSTAKTYLCNQGSYSITFSFKTCLPLIESGLQAWYYSYSSIHSYPSQCRNWLSFTGKAGPQMSSSSSHNLCSFPALEWTEGWAVGFLMYQSMSALLHYGMTITSRSFGVKFIQQTIEVSGELCISSFLGVVQVSSGTCNKSNFLF